MNSIRTFRVLLLVALAAAVWPLGRAYAADGLKATVIDRIGNRHEVEKLTFKNRKEMPYYVGDKRFLVSLEDIDRFRLEGERGDEEQKIVLVLRSGKKINGRVSTGGAGVTPHQDSFGGGQTGNRLSGVTDLGPFFILLSDVKEVILRHDGPAKAERQQVYKATVIDVEGKRYEVSDLRVYDKTRFDYHIGRKKRFKKFAKIAQIEFAEGDGISAEFRPLTITLRTGKTVQGTVDASTVRISGETDRMYFDRVGSAITGRLAGGGVLAMGLHDVKLVRFKWDEADGSQEASSPAPSSK